MYVRHIGRTACQRNDSRCIKAVSCFGLRASRLPYNAHAWIGATSYELVLTQLSCRGWCTASVRAHADLTSHATDNSRLSAPRWQRDNIENSFWYPVIVAWERLLYESQSRRGMYHSNIVWLCWPSQIATVIYLHGGARYSSLFQTK